MRYIDPIHRLEIKKTIDDFKEGVYCHSRLVGEKVIPMHVHGNKSQLMYAEGKCIRIYYEEAHEVKTIFIPARHFAWMPMGVPHSVEANHPDFILTNIFYTEVFEEYFYQQVGVYAANNLLVELLKHIQSWNGIIRNDDFKKYSVLNTIMCILSDASNRKLPIALPVAKEKRLQEVLNYMQDQLTEPISIATISNRFGFSERSLLRLFQEDLNMSYAQYLKTLRVVNAIELLTTTNLTINEIAFTVGYDSFPTFSNTFQDVVGVRPKIYRV
ncbi:MAG: AraC family transcriptional regulator [Spirosomataceae bacterium]